MNMKSTMLRNDGPHVVKLGTISILVSPFLYVYFLIFHSFTWHLIFGYLFKFDKNMSRRKVAHSSINKKQQLFNNIKTMVIHRYHYSYGTICVSVLLISMINNIFITNDWCNFCCTDSGAMGSKKTGFSLH